MDNRLSNKAFDLQKTNPKFFFYRLLAIYFFSTSELICLDNQPIAHGDLAVGLAIAPTKLHFQLRTKASAIRCVEHLLERLSYLLRDCPMAKREIDLEIEKNKELTTYIKGTVERRYKKSA